MKMVICEYFSQNNGTQTCTNQLEYPQIILSCSNGLYKLGHIGCRISIVYSNQLYLIIDGYI